MSIAALLAQHNHVIAVDVIPKKVKDANIIIYEPTLQDGLFWLSHLNDLDESKKQSDAIIASKRPNLGPGLIWLR